MIRFLFSIIIPTIFFSLLEFSSLEFMITSQIQSHIEEIKELLFASSFLQYGNGFIVKPS